MAALNFEFNDNCDWKRHNSRAIKEKGSVRSMDELTRARMLKELERELDAFERAIRDAEGALAEAEKELIEALAKEE